MDQTIKSDVIRKGSTRVQLYNEGLLVYLYDEKNRQALIEQKAHDLLHGSFGEQKEKKLAPLSRSHMVVAYELYQDDPIEVDIVVGDPLAANEMKPIRRLKWHKPQKALLSLSSGCLRVETPNSCHFAPDEEPQEAGASIQVPPGEYVLTLYHVDLNETDDAAWKEYWEERQGPAQVIVLTPVAQTKPPRQSSALLRFPVRKPKLTWIGNYSVSGQSADCKINFWDYWEFFKLNLDRAALAALKVEPGSLLEIDAVGKKFTLLYLEGLQLGLGHLGAYKMIFGNERMTAGLKELPEVAFGVYQTLKDVNLEILAGMRIKATETVDKKYHDKWQKAKVQVLEKLELVDRTSFRKWTLEQGALHGEVLFRTDYYISMNFDAAALEALQAKVGDVLRLRVGEKTAVLRLLENQKQFLASSKAQWQKDGPWEKLKDRFTFAKDDEEKEKVRQEMREFLLHDTPLFAYLDTHWYDREQKIFLAHPSAVESGFFKFNFKHGLPVDPGSKVVLERA
jgi:hypothetical protein